MKNKPLMKLSALAAMAILVAVAFVGLPTTADVDWEDLDGYWVDGYKWQVPMFAGQDIPVGTVTVWLDNDGYIQVVYDITEDDWELTESHIAIVTGDCDEITGADFPTTKSLNPKVGQFPYTVEDFPIEASEVGYDEGDSICFATHAVVERPDGYGGYETQTGWAGDHDFGGKSWAVYFCYKPDRKYLTLPSSIDFTATNPGSSSYWDMAVSSGGDDIPAGTYPAFCIQQGVYMSENHLYEDAAVYSSYDSSNPYLSSIGEENWAKITYIVNAYYPAPAGFTWSDVQNAIWHFAGTTHSHNAKVDTIVSACADKGDYYPPAGGNLAIVIFVGSTVQGTFMVIDP